MALPVKTIVTPEPMPTQAVSSIFKSVAIDVSTKFAGTVYWDVVGTLALWMESSQKASGNDTWVIDQTWYSSSSSASGVFSRATVNDLISSPPVLAYTYPTGLNPTGFAISNQGFNYFSNTRVFISGLANEFHYITSLTNLGGVPITYAYTTEQAPTPGVLCGPPYSLYLCNVSCPASRLKFDLDFSTISRIRFVVTGAGWSRVALTTLDSVS